MDSEILSFQENLVRICLEIYKEIGSFGPEKLYQNALTYELKQLYTNKYHIVEEDKIPIYYKNMIMSSKRTDISIYKSINDLKPFIILELKWIPRSSTGLDPYQLSNYLLLKECVYGFMINFEKIGQHPTEFCANVYNIETNEEIKFKKQEQKTGLVVIERFENKNKNVPEKLPYKYNEYFGHILLNPDNTSLKKTETETETETEKEPRIFSKIIDMFRFYSR